MKNRFTIMFENLQVRHEKAFVPAVTLGDPGFKTNCDILQTLIDNGADALNLNLAFSDPSAECDSMAMAAKRALQNGIDVKSSFEIIKIIRDSNPDLPISLNVYANLVTARGLEHFYQEAKASGVDAILVPDVPVEMLDAQTNFKQNADKQDLQVVLIAPPNMNKQQINTIANNANAYVELMPKFNDSMQRAEEQIVATLKNCTQAKSLLACELENLATIKNNISSDIDGFINKSTVSSIISQNLNNETKLFAELASFAKDAKAITRF